jgi:hypothetical protein
MPVETVAVSAEEMRAKAHSFQAKIRRRNRVEYIATAFVVVVFGWYATRPSPATLLWPIANVMVIVGILVVALNLHLRARAVAPPSAASATSLIDFQRAELVRQRDALKSVWLWYIGPVVPGVIVWFIAAGMGTLAKYPDRGLTPLIGAGVVVALVFVILILLNLLGAARLQRQIDALDHYKEKT